MAQRPSTRPRNHDVGRPKGKGNPTPVQKIIRDKDKMIDAMRTRALSGDPAAVEACLRLADGDS